MSNTIKQAILALKSRIADAYTAILAKGGTLPTTQDSANLPTAIASIPSSSFDMDGFIFDEGYEPTTAGELTNVFLPHLKEIDNDSIQSLKVFFVMNNTTVERVELRGATTTSSYSGTIDATLLSRCSSLAYISIPNLTELNFAPDHAFSYNGNLLELHLPKVGYVTGSRQFSENSKLQVCDLTMCSRLANAYHFIRDYDLIELHIGAGMTNSFFINYWSPTNALDANSSSLVETGEPFANNLEKLLYNIREYIAANLRTDVGNKTITMSAAVKAAINADPATLAAFPSNWTIA